MRMEQKKRSFLVRDRFVEKHLERYMEHGHEYIVIHVKGGADKGGADIIFTIDEARTLYEQIGYLL
jgi:hypothetical protein